MKKMLLPLGLMISLSSPSFAVEVDQLNQSVKSILAPLQNQNTSANITFKKIDFDEVRTKSLVLNASYHKQSSNNHFNIDLDNLQYEYGDGSAPIVKLAGSVQVDLSKLFSQQQANEFISGMSEFFESLANDASSDKLEDALKVDSVLTSVRQDDKNNYQGLTAIVSLDVSFNELPQNLPINEVQYSRIVFSLSMDLNVGASFNGYMIMNPKLKYYEEGETGLKEKLLLLLSNDEKEIKQYTDLIFFFDTMATLMLEGRYLSNNTSGNLHHQ